MGSALIISLRKRRIRCPTRSKHRFYVPFVRQNAGGFRKAPSTFEGGPFGGQCPPPCPAQEVCIAGDSAPGRGHTHQRPLVVGLSPPPCLVREVCIAGDSASGRGHTYQRPLALGSARRLVRPGRSALPETVPRGEAIHISAPLSLGCARSLVRPIFLCCSLYHAPGLFPCLLPGRTCP